MVDGNITKTLMTFSAYDITKASCTCMQLNVNAINLRLYITAITASLSSSR